MLKFNCFSPLALLGVHFNGDKVLSFNLKRAVGGALSAASPCKLGRSSVFLLYGAYAVTACVPGWKSRYKCRLQSSLISVRLFLNTDYCGTASSGFSDKLQEIRIRALYPPGVFIPHARYPTTFLTSPPVSKTLSDVWRGVKKKKNMGITMTRTGRALSNQWRDFRG